MKRKRFSLLTAGGGLLLGLVILLVRSNHEAGRSFTPPDAGQGRAGDDSPAERGSELLEAVNRQTFAGGATIIERLRLISEFPPELMNEALASPVLQEWMSSNPEAALAWISGRSEVSVSIVFSLMQEWAQKDPHGVGDYLKSLPAGAWHDIAHQAAANAVLISDPLEALTIAAQIGSFEVRGDMLESVVTEWARRDPEAAARWAGQFPEDALRERILLAVAVGLADSEPRLAASWMEKLPGPGEGRNRAITEITRAWVRSDPTEAGRWFARVSQIPTESSAQTLRALLSRELWDGADDGT